MNMSNEEMAVKVVCGVHAIEDLLKEEFFRMLVGTDKDRLLAVTQRALEKVPWEGKPTTNQAANEYLWRCSFAIRNEIIQEYAN